MSNEQLLQRLHVHQQIVVDIMRNTEMLLNQPGLRDTLGLARARWALMRALTDYQLFKHRAIFDPAIGGTVLGTAQRAARMKTACTAIGEQFRAHVTKWSATDVGGRWAEYQPAALVMIGRIRAHLAIERADIDTLLSAGASPVAPRSVSPVSR